MTVSKLAALSIFGGAIGVHLGQSAVREINPFYFSEPETRFHADLAPNLVSYEAQAQPPQYFDAAFVDGSGNGCVLCQDYPEEYRPVQDPAVEDPDKGEASVPEYAGAGDVVLKEMPARENRQIQPYQHYAITMEAGTRGQEMPVAYEREEIDISALR